MTKTPTKSKKRSVTSAINQRHGIKFKAIQKRWNKHRSDVLVLEQMTNEWYKAPVNLMRAHVGKQGGLHPARFPYTLKIWFFALTYRQLYYTKLLSDTLHYVVRGRDLKCFRRHLNMRGYTSEYIGPGKSYVPSPSTPDTPEIEKPFLAVFNAGTPQMDKRMVELIQEVNLANTFDFLAKVPADPARGNVQKTFGFSPTGFDRHDYNHYIPTPQALTGNADPIIIQKFVAFTKLQRYTMEKYPGVKELIGKPLDPVKDEQRKCLSSQTIHPDNENDNVTLGANILQEGEILPYKLAKGANHKLRAHCDKHNSRVEGYQAQTNCSQDFIVYKDEKQVNAILRKGITTGENSVVRAFNSCYMKQACDDAVERTAWMMSLFRVTDEYYNNLPLYCRTFKNALRYGAYLSRKQANAVKKSKNQKIIPLSTLDPITPIPRCLAKDIVLGNINDSKFRCVCYYYKPGH